MNLNLIKLIDKFILPVPCYLFGLKKKKMIDNPKKILFIKMWSIGDGVLTLPLIKATKLKYPESQIDVFCHKKLKDLFENNIYISNLILFDINLKFIKHVNLFKKYDISIDTDPFLNVSALISWFTGKSSIGFSHSARSKVFTLTSNFKEQHTFHNYIDLMEKLDVFPERVLEKICINNETKNKVDKILKDNSIKKTDFLIGICPGVSESVKTRMWSLEKFAKLADYLIEKNTKIIILDGPENKNIADTLISLMEHSAINLTGKTTLKETIYIIENCNLFISNDTGPMHMAAAQKTKTIGLFGPNTPIRWSPYGNNISIYKKVNCSPCINNKKGITPKCKYKGTLLEQHCMKEITVEEVINQI